MDSPQYVPGYEPSAPPLPPAQEWNYGGGGQPNNFYPPASQGQYKPPPTVGEYILSVFGNVAKGILRTSHTIARVDLVRPYPRRERGEGEEEEEEYAGDGPRGAYYSRPTNEMVPSRMRNRTYSGLYGLRAVQGRGARLKLMQIWDFPSKETGEPSLPWGLNIGVGVNYDVDNSQIEPKLRFRTKQVAFHVLPKPEFEIHAKYPLGVASLLLDLKFRMPLDKGGESVRETVWETAGASRLTMNLTHAVGTGVHLAPGGLEFDERVWKIGKHTNLRLAASLSFPRRIPLERDPVQIRVHRLGLRTRLA